MIITKKYLKKLIKEQLNEQKINEQFLSFEQQKWVIKNALFNLNKLRNDVSQEMRNLKKSKLDNFPSQEFRGTQKQLNGLDNIIKTLSDRNLSDSKKINFLKNYPNLKIELPNIYKTFLNSGLFEQLNKHNNKLYEQRAFKWYLFYKEELLEMTSRAQNLLNNHKITLYPGEFFNKIKLTCNLNRDELFIHLITNDKNKITFKASFFSNKIEVEPYNGIFIWAKDAIDAGVKIEELKNIDVKLKNFLTLLLKSFSNKSQFLNKKINIAPGEFLVHGLKNVNESLYEQTLYDPHQSTIDRRMYANTLKQGQNILKYPSQREIDHEIMRIKTLWMNRPAQYELRLTKITNPQKMYNAYVSIMAWLKINPEYRKNMEKILDKVRWYLRKNGYEDMLVGKGGNVPISLRESRLRKKFVNENISSMQWTTKDFPIGAKVIATDLFGGNRPTLKGSVVKVTSDTVYIKTNDGIKPAGSLSYEIVLEGKTPIRESKLKSLIKRLINEQISSEVNEERYQLEVMSFVKDKNLNRVKSKLSYDTRLKNFEGDGNPDDTNKHLDNGFYSFYYYFLNSGDALNFAKKIINNFDEHVSVIVTDTERNKIIFQDETLDQQHWGR